MKIAEGCSLECSFCTIPFIKGPHVSRPVEDIVEEAGNLAANGVRELILISQDTTAYGSDVGTNLRKLLKKLDEVEGIRWIRLHYLYPTKISESLLDTIAESRHIIPYFDIPLQHVSPKILRSMQRLKPTSDLLKLVKKIRERFESAPLPACIRTTFMTGFPGETEEDFDMLMDFLEEARLDRVTVFQFSPELVTAASRLPDEVSEHVAERRKDRIMEAQQEISFGINEEWIGKTLEILLEGETEDGRRVGRSYRDALEIDGSVVVEGVPENIEAGSFVMARITEALPYDLAGEMV